MYAAYQKLCGEDERLKPKHKQLEVIGLMNALNFLREFKSEWIRVVISQFHDGRFRLDEPVEITKKMIHVIIGYPTTDKVKAIHNAPRAKIEKNTGAEWDE